MNVHTISVKNRVVSVDDRMLIANGVNVDTITLDLDDEWLGLQVTIILGSGAKALKARWRGVSLPVPSSLIQETGPLAVSIVGEGSGKRLTTKAAPRAFFVSASGTV